MEPEKKSVYTDSAHQALILGVYFSVMFLLQSAFGSVWTNLAGSLMMLAVPFVAYRLMARRYRVMDCRASFSEVWLHGILLFLFSSILMALVVYLYIRFLNPGFLAHQVAAAIEVYRAAGLEDMASQMEGIAGAGALPSAIQFALLIMWVGSFSGSVLSLLEAGIIKTFIRK